MTGTGQFYGRRDNQKGDPFSPTPHKVLTAGGLGSKTEMGRGRIIPVSSPGVVELQRSRQPRRPARLVHIPPLPVLSCATLLVPLSPHLGNKDGNSFYFTRLL